MTQRGQCETCGLSLETCQYEGFHPRNVREIAADQVLDALDILAYEADDFLRWPWAALDSLYGGMAPGTVHYVVAFSGMGKTTFIGSAILRWLEAGHKIDVMPLENKPNIFRAYLACQTLGIDPGLMMSGDYLLRDDAAELRERVRQAVIHQTRDKVQDLLDVHGVAKVSAGALRNAARRAAARGAKALIVDHIDHVSDTDGNVKRSLWEASVAVNTEAHDVAKDTGMPLILMSQANQESLRGSRDKLAKFMPLQENNVLFGGQKRMVATGMIGLYRPLLPMPSAMEDVEEWKEAIRLARLGTTEPQTALEPWTMGVNLMKSRNYGSREGKRVSLAWEAGRIVDRVIGAAWADEARAHGIRTHRSVA